MAKKTDTWMPLYVGDYLADTAHMTTEQHGAYLLLLMAAWRRGGELPNDDAQLAAIARMAAPAWKKSKAIVTSFFKTNGDVLTQSRLSAEIERSQSVSAARTESGKKGGRPPKQKQNESIKKPNGYVLLNQNETQSQSQLQRADALEQQPHLKIVTGGEMPLGPDQPGFDLSPTEFAKAVAAIYGEVYGVEPPPVPLMVAMGISQRPEFYEKCANLDWWQNYFLSCRDDLFLTNRESLDQPMGRKASGFKYLISEECIGSMVERSRRELAHG